MSLKQQLTEDMKTAMRARDMVRLNTIRFLQAEIRNIEIDNGEQDDAGIHKIIARQIKQLKEGIAEYESAGRADTVAEEQQKLTVLEGYLPQQMSDEALQIIIKEVMEANPGMAQGQLIGQVMRQVSGQADGQRVSQMVQATLAA